MITINKNIRRIKNILLKRHMLKSNFKPLEQLFYKALNSNFFYLQIGANDGVSFDPIYQLVTKEKVKGIVIEPIPYYFNQLKENYKNQPQVKLLNVAVHSYEKKMKMYRVNPVVKNYPDWVKGLPSFNKEHLIKANIKENDILEEIVNCMSFDDLILQNNITNIDLLQIDTEGYDIEIIKMINFNKIAPKIISFEHNVKQGVIKEEDFFNCIQLLFKNGYNIVILENDAIAYRGL